MLRSLVQLRSEQTSIADRKSIMEQFQTLEKTIQEHVKVTKMAHSAVERQKLELERDLDDEGDDDAQQKLAIREVEEEFRLLEADQISSGVIFSQVHSRLTRQDISKVRICGVNTQKNSAAAVGVFDSNVDMRGFFAR
jgi:hypothetical protein